ncbi:TetR family transcriptional regulator [Halobacteriovorax sp.]|uniref:TetR family transcriptional regulator n=1 Tax=Halobacteriovorax sp. TaxID=2020862 RepID=UPI00356AFC75
MTKINETKCKIIEVALKLFSCKGYNGTSVRDIAKQADVNLASVNYHFNNKQNLYLEVFSNNCSQVEEDLENLYTQGMSLEDFSVAMFEFFLDNSHNLLNTFRLILNESIDFTSECKVSSTHLGPPAGGLILKLITEEVGEDVPLDGRFWAVSSLTAQIVHMAIILNSSVIKERCSHFPHINKSSQVRNIRLQCRSLLNFLRSEPHTTWDETFKLDI